MMMMTRNHQRVRRVVGNNLKTIREAKGLSQAELARRINVDKSTVSRLEGEGVRLASHHIEKLTKALNCRPEDLVADGKPLSAGEREFLERWRNLSPEDQAQLSELAERLLRSQ